MNNKGLRIQTDFLESEDPHISVVTTSKINYMEKLDAATLLEKILSIILAKNFIDCWKELKSGGSPVQSLRYNGRRIANQNAAVHETRERTIYFENIQNKNMNIRSHSQQRFIKSQVASEMQDSRRPSRNKSMRVINQEIEYSRASVLKEIVEKLKNIRRVQVNEQEQANNEEVIKKIGHLERMIRSIKNTNHREIQQSKAKQIRARIKSSTEEEHDNQEGQRSSQKQRQDNTVIQKQDEEMVRSFMQQIQKIKNEIRQIKVSNEAILKSELERSRASSNSEQAHAHHAHHHYHHTQLQNTEVQTLKETISSGVQTANLVNQETMMQKKNSIRYGEQSVQVATPVIEPSRPEVIKPEVNSRVDQRTYVSNNYVQVESKPEPKEPKNSGTNIYEAPQPSRKFSPINTYYHLLPSDIAAKIKNESQQRMNRPSSSAALNDITKSSVQQSLSQPYAPSIMPLTFPANQFQPKPEPQTHTQIQPPIQPQLQQHHHQQPNFSQPQLQFQFRPQQFKPPSQPVIQFNIQPNNLPQPQVVNSQFPQNFPGRQTQPQQVLEYPRFDQIKTNTTFYSKNNVYSDVNSSSSLGLNWQPGHYRNPSIQTHEGLANNTVTFSSYCSACGRNCGCPRTFPSQSNQL